MKIYIGCAVQNVDEKTYWELLARIEWLKNELLERGHVVLNFKSINNRDSLPQDVFQWDWEQCMACDALIALALYPSTGLGMEIAYCLTRRIGIAEIPAFVFATAPKGQNVSKMLLGCTHPSFRFEFFETFEHIPELFETSEREYQKQRLL